VELWTGNHVEEVCHTIEVVVYSFTGHCDYRYVDTAVILLYAQDHNGTNAHGLRVELLWQIRYTIQKSLLSLMAAVGLSLYFVGYFCYHTSALRCAP
jgi:hypothetical protein